MASMLFNQKQEESRIAICENGHGEFSSTRLWLLSEWSKWSVCEACEAEKESSQEAILNQQKRKKRRVALHQRSGIEKRFSDKTFEAFMPKNSEAKKYKNLCMDYATNFDKRLEAGASLVLCGGVGTGKTHLASAIANAAINKHLKEVRYTSVMRLTRAVKSTYAKASKQSEQEAIDSFLSHDLLVIDEVGVQYGSEAEKIILYEILDGRYSKQKPTILLSNLSFSELVDCLGMRILDRMKENGGAIMSFEWESYRK